MIKRSSTRMLRALWVLSILIWLPDCAAADEWTVTFRMHSHDLAEDAAVYITGSVRGLGNWRPDAVPMQYAGDHVWTCELTVDREQTIEYKYTLGSWQREGAGADGLPLENLTVTVDRSLVQEDQINFWTSGQQRPIQGQITGTVRYHRQMEGEGLRPRDIIVWLPPDYDDSGTTRYPVLYMHDGQNIVDPQTSSFGVDWQIDETCTQLIDEQRIPPMIVVGIYNTPDRNREYLPGEIGEAYMQFITETLKPFIDKTYHTASDRQHTWTGGASWGGLIAFMLAWEHSEVFSGAICMSPGFQITSRSIELDYVSHVLDSPLPEGKTTLYIDSGGVGLEKNLQPGIDAMLEALRGRGLEDGKQLHWVLAPTDRHHEAAWARRMPGALLLLTGGQ